MPIESFKIRSSKSLAVAAAAALLLAGDVQAAKYKTPAGNFIVTAKDPEVARQVGEYAEHFRRVKALEWLGYELPPWGQSCTIEVRITHGGAGGATSFAFDRGQILSQQMTVEGNLERILNSVVPHEVTHTIFAARFRRPLPRWADEGGAVLSEDYQELARHDLLVRQLINQGRMIPLTRLFVLTEYPRDVMALYAQGFSIANFVVSMIGKQRYLDFVEDGQVYGWEFACQRHLHYRAIPQLEDAWIQWLRDGRGTGADGPNTLAGTQWNIRGATIRAQTPDDDERPAAWPPSRRMESTPAIASTPRPTTAARTGEQTPIAQRANDPFEEYAARVAGAKETQVFSKGETGKSAWDVSPVAATNEPIEQIDEPTTSKITAGPAPSRSRQSVPIAVGRTRRNHSLPAPSRPAER